MRLDLGVQARIGYDTPLGEESFAAEWAEGQKTPFDQAIAEVLAELAGPVPG